VSTGQAVAGGFQDIQRFGANCSAGAAGVGFFVADGFLTV